MHQLEFPPEEPLRAELAAFIDSIEKRMPSPVDRWAGFHAVRVVEAALESAQTGTWIDVSESSCDFLSSGSESPASPLPRERVG